MYACFFLRCRYLPNLIVGLKQGGHVYAQAVWAASQTVGEGFVVHVCKSRAGGRRIS